MVALVETLTRTQESFPTLGSQLLGTAVVLGVVAVLVVAIRFPFPQRVLTARDEDGFRLTGVSDGDNGVPRGGERADARSDGEASADATTDVTGAEPR